MRHRQENCFMTIPYRIRRGLRRFFIAAGILALLSIVAMMAWMLWLNRYVIYTDEGARLDFGLSFEHAGGVIAQPPSTTPSVSISYGNTEELAPPPSTELAQLTGYTLTFDMLTTQLAETTAALAQIPSGSAVVLDVKDIRGEFYYSSLLGRIHDGVDVDAITQLIRDLNNRGCYVIARLPAFRDYWYFIDDQRNRVPYGLPKAGGNGSLWADTSVSKKLHYWFNPASSGTINFLGQVITELRVLGFNEVLFSDFCFPETEEISFEGDKTEALNQAASTLVQACTTDTFAVSFIGNHFTLPEGRCRLYLENVAAADIPQLVATLRLENPTARLVFLTDLLDTRYEDYSVLRPLELP